MVPEKGTRRGRDSDHCCQSEDLTHTHTYTHLGIRRRTCRSNIPSLENVWNNISPLFTSVCFSCTDLCSLMSRLCSCMQPTLTPPRWTPSCSVAWEFSLTLAGSTTRQWTVLAPLCLSHRRLVKKSLLRRHLCARTPCSVRV